MSEHDDQSPPRGADAKVGCGGGGLVPAGSAPQFRGDLACEACGSFGVFVFDGHSLCAYCCSTRGACCAEREDE